MLMIRKTGTVLAMAALLSLTVAVCDPVGLMAQEKKDPAAMYEACMDKAEASLLRCVESSGELEYLCWSKYGYDKLGCTISYGIRVIVWT